MIRIRPAVSGDDEAIRRLAEKEGAQVSPSRERGLAHSILLVAEQGDLADVPLGFVLGWVVAEELELLDLVVDPNWRRRGVAGRLVEALFERSHDRGARAVFLEVRRTNEAAQALYRQLGFEQVGERPRYYAGGEDALLFRCCLPRGA